MADGLFTATSYYEDQLKAGQEYQDFVAQSLLSEGIVLVNFATKRWQLDYGENALGLEIKFDQIFADSGNFWIELQERTTPDRMYVESGICRQDNSWLYGLGNYEEFFIFSKRTLRIDSRQRVIRENKRLTSRGYLLSRREAVELAERMFVFKRYRP